MGWLDKAKVLLGIVDAEDVEEEGEPRAEKRVTLKGGRPSLEGFEAAPQETLQDVLALREAGDTAAMRKLLEQLDKGRGLRVVLRAAAALEAGDEGELRSLLPKVREEARAWKLPLQLSAALKAGERAAKYREQAARAGAPPWALAWMDTASSDANTQRRGLVELLFADAALAHMVAARDLEIAGVTEDASGAQRFVSVAHGRDCIARFGAEVVADLLDRAGEP